MVEYTKSCGKTSLFIFSFETLLPPTTGSFHGKRENAKIIYIIIIFLNSFSLGKI